MRKFTLFTFSALLILWGISYLLNRQVEKEAKTHSLGISKDLKTQKNENELLTKSNIRKLNQIGEVINEENANIDSSIKNEIEKEKIVYDRRRDLKHKQIVLEQSFADPQSSVKDIKRIQNEIVELKTKMNAPLVNTERWDPLFVYYLMMQENYTYSEVNQIQSLSENGISAEEINYINDVIKDKNFQERIKSYKGLPEANRSLASIKHIRKEKDEFIDEVGSAPSLETKLIEMDYSPDEKEEMIYGHNIQ